MAKEAAAQVSSDHTFVVPAYGHSPHLDACLASLSAQTAKSRIVVTTSTPFHGIDSLAIRHGAAIFVHGPSLGIAHDWNVSLAQSRSTWTTIAHQDDVYHPEYVHRIITAGTGIVDPLIVFSNYAERRSHRIVHNSGLLRLKRILLELGFLGRTSVSSTAAKRRTLRFGSPIPCPAVTYHRSALGKFRFREDLRVSLDWAAWLDLSATAGAFVWLREVLMEHRIHGASETVAGLRDGARHREDFEILSSIWPRPLARLIMLFFRVAY